MLELLKTHWPGPWKAEDGGWTHQSGERRIVFRESGGRFLAGIQESIDENIWDAPYALRNESSPEKALHALRKEIEEEIKALQALLHASTG